MLYECLYECRWEVPGIQRSNRGGLSRGTRFWRSSRSQQYTRTNQLISDGLIKGQHLKTIESVCSCLRPRSLLVPTPPQGKWSTPAAFAPAFAPWYARRLRAVYCNALVSSCRHMWMFPFMGMGRQRPTPAPTALL